MWLEWCERVPLDEGLLAQAFIKQRFYAGAERRFYVLKTY
ncbi:hypothetical protein PPE_05230 [Paenibacillus polymyxa E681]|nr:hypothetical protein PPE_05230 [Paenibacillus polymyxa E681]